MRSTRRRSGENRTIWLVPCLAVAIVVAIVMAESVIPSIWSATNGGERAMVTSDEVNLRSGPGTDFDVITVVPAGTRVATFGQQGDFSSVRVAGKQGWISVDYLQSPDGASQPLIAAADIPATEPPVVEAVTVVETEPYVAPTAIPTTVAPTAVPTSEPVKAQEVQAQSAPQSGEHWIEVNRTTRTVTLHDGDIVVAQFDALIGRDPSADGYYSTAVGTYRVWVMEKSLTETPFAEDVYLTDFVGFDPDRSNGFHSPTRDADGNVVVTGGTQTMGCVRLAELDAVQLFEFAYIGMRVEIHD